MDIMATKRALICEKLTTCLIRPDLLHKLNLNTITFGFRAAQICNTKLNLDLTDFICGLCTHVIKGAFMCKNCSTPYCDTCIQTLRSVGQQLRLDSLVHSTDKNEFLCLRNLCWTQEKLGYKTALRPPLNAIYDSTVFTCDRQYCGQRITYSYWQQHAAYCKRGPIIDHIDYSLRGRTPTQLSWINADQEKTLSFQDLLNPAINAPRVITHEQRFKERYDEYHYLVKNHPSFPVRHEFGDVYNFTEDEAKESVTKTHLIRTNQIHRPNYEQRWQESNAQPTTTSDSPFISLVPSLPPPPDVSYIETHRAFNASTSQDKSVSSRPTNLPDERRFKYYVHSEEQKRLFKNRPQPQMPELPEEVQLRINVNTPEFLDSWSLLSMHHASMIVTRTGYPNGTATACWIAVTNHLDEIVFESFIKHPRDTIVDCCTRFHGLCFEDIKLARSLEGIKKQLAPFLAQARIIVLMDAQATFLSLNLTQEEIDVLKPKVRDMLRHYSPRLGQKIAYRYIAYLLFERYDVWKNGRCPINEAKLGMYLYLYEIRQIETDHQYYTDNNINMERSAIPHNQVAKLYIEMQQRIQDGTEDWPASFNSPYEPSRLRCRLR